MSREMAVSLSLQQWTDMSTIRWLMKPYLLYRWAYLAPLPLPTRDDEVVAAMVRF